MPMNFRLVVEEGMLTRHYDFAKQVVMTEPMDFWAIDEGVLYLGRYFVSFKAMVRESGRPREMAVVCVPLLRVKRIVVTRDDEERVEEDDGSIVRRIVDEIEKGTTS